ncbi:DUF6378 domain-containing protein [uncultured Acinetobacter sp.]|uniref:DUF6378 domain-containing protein n=1 Tax=uncultured Acinetobacter sp. TaxID=165433 RepID=UPI0026217BBC|nr:DUF6378 domain-containing protein [uncultured Acinetobacter sp.]
MSIDWSKAPEGATHCLIKDSGTAWFRFKDDLSFPNTWKDGEWKNVRLPTRELTPKPKQPKPLTQAVFDGLPPEYRWAAVDRDGDCFVFGAIPEELDGYGWGCEHGTLSDYIGENFNTTDWQNSLIERQDVSNRVEQLRSVEEARQVEATLAERQNQYGNFKDVAHLSQGLQSLLSVGNFSDTQQEAIQMICSKLARLACGDADHVDSWHDIAGYATLVVKDLESGK